MDNLRAGDYSEDNHADCESNLLSSSELLEIFKPKPEVGHSSQAEIQIVSQVTDMSVEDGLSAKKFSSVVPRDDQMIDIQIKTASSEKASKRKKHATRGIKKTPFKAWIKHEKHRAARPYTGQRSLANESRGTDVILSTLKSGAI